MTIAVVTRPGDPFYDDLAQAARELGLSISRCDARLAGEQSFSVSAKGVEWADADTGTLQWIIVRGLRYQYPAVPLPEDDFDFALWRADYPALQQRYSALMSALAEAQRRGVRIANTIDVLQQDFAKAAQLERLAANGIPTPEFLCTNDPATADAFRCRHENVLWRAATGRSAWQHFARRQFEHLVDRTKLPILLAGSRAGNLVRTYVFGSEHLVSYRVGLPDVVGEREYLERFLATECPVPRSELARVVEALDAEWLMLTFEVHDEGAQLLDVDVDPRPEDGGPTLCAHVARQMMRVAAGSTVEPAVRTDEILERRTLFPRQMLQMPIAMELSKYRNED